MMNEAKHEWAQVTDPDSAADYRRMGWTVGEPTKQGRNLVWPVSRPVQGAS